MSYSIRHNRIPRESLLKFKFFTVKCQLSFVDFGQYGFKRKNLWRNKYLLLVKNLKLITSKSRLIFDMVTFVIKFLQSESVWVYSHSLSLWGKRRTKSSKMGGKYSSMDPMQVEVPEIDKLLSRDPYLNPYEREIRRRYVLFFFDIDKVSLVNNLWFITSSFLFQQICLFQRFNWIYWWERRWFGWIYEGL